MRTWRIVAVVSLVAGCALPVPRAGAPFVPAPPSPEPIWEGTAPGWQQGVLVIRSRSEWDRVVGGLDPAYSGAMPDFGKAHVLLVVGRERENPCRDTVLQDVSVRGREARVTIEERVPPADCGCLGPALPPRAWLVAVPSAVTRASRSITDTVLPCEKAREIAHRAGSRPVLVLEASWDEPPGARLLTSGDQVREVAKRLGKPLPDIDPTRERLVLVTGRPRSNGCRRTRVVEAEVEDTTVRFVVEERYPAPGETCAMIFRLPAVFVYRVPATVEKAVVEVREVTGTPAR